MNAIAAAGHRQSELLNNYSIEMTAKDVAHLEQAADVIPKGTKIPVTFLPGETFEMRIAAAKRVRELGFLPIPHISARRLSSQAGARGLPLRPAARSRHGPCVRRGGRSAAAAWVLTRMRSRSSAAACWPKYGIRRVGISGYPEGHPDIGNEKLWQAMRDKQIAIQERGHDFAVVTQFSFDAEPVLTWLEQVRKAGIQARCASVCPAPQASSGYSPSPLAAAWAHRQRCCRSTASRSRSCFRLRARTRSCRTMRRPRSRQAWRRAAAFLSFRRLAGDSRVGAGFPREDWRVVWSSSVGARELWASLRQQRVAGGQLMRIPCGEAMADGFFPDLVLRHRSNHLVVNQQAIDVQRLVARGVGQTRTQPPCDSPHISRRRARRP